VRRGQECVRLRTRLVEGGGGLHRHLRPLPVVERLLEEHGRKQRHGRCEFLQEHGVISGKETHLWSRVDAAACVGWARRGSPYLRVLAERSLHGSELFLKNAALQRRT
jgi:hypothetical protein